MKKVASLRPIDLGRASRETKGMQTQFAADELNQHKPSPGLAQD
jgi:hypothetical protein